MQNYQEFLQIKLKNLETVGIDCIDSEISEKAFKFQKHLIKLALKKGRYGLFLGTGLGKSLAQLNWANILTKRLGIKALILAPLGVAKQTVDEGKKFGIDIKYVAQPGDITEDYQIFITNYERLENFDCSIFDAVVLDECFAKDTLIDCVIDNKFVQKSIENVKIGDKILNASGIDIVSNVHRREIQYAIKVIVDADSIICSPNHPFFTQFGWVGAQDLTPNHRILKTKQAQKITGNYDEFNNSLRILPNTFQPSSMQQKSNRLFPILREILFSEMADETTRAYNQSTQPTSSQEKREESQRVSEIWKTRSFGSNSQNYKIESNGESRNSVESLPKIERDAAQTFRAWGQWEGINCSTEDTFGCTRELMGSGIRFITGQTESGLSNTLQARLSESRSKNLYRSGWQLTLQQKRDRQKEGFETSISWVESIEILEQGHPELEKFRDADGKLYFYDIGATQHPSFSVKGLLVHNSSILKSYTSSTRNLIIDSFEKTPYKLSCSATPSPNDYMELGNQAEFLGIMSRVEMLSMFFEHDGGDTSKWILKYHARNNFWEWVNSWSIMINHPRDLGEEFDQPGYDLPPLNFTTHKVDTKIIIDSKKLIQPEAKGLSEQRKVRSKSLEDRCKKAAEIINNSSPSEYPWLIWCETNAESELLTKLLPDAIEVKGSDKETKKEKVAKDFANKQIDVLITKPSIFGYGMNWQQCCNVIYIGLTHSAEDFYQSVRRLYRFGQENTVNVHIIQHPLEGQIERNLKRKEAEALAMLQGMVNASKTYQNATRNRQINQIEIIIPSWLNTEC